MRLRNQNSYTVPMKYKKRQLIKHIQLFAADVDIKGWLKILCKQLMFLLCCNGNKICWTPKFQK